MSLKNSNSSYGSIAKLLHWLVAFSVIGMIIIGFSLHRIPRPQRYTIIQLHKSIGFTLLIIMAIRLIWRFISPPPPLPSSIPGWQRISAKISHALLYLTTFVMTISGWLMSSFFGYPINWFFLFKIPLPVTARDRALGIIFSDIHHITAWAFSILIVIHTLAALKHHLIDKDNVLKRMLPSKN